MFCTRLANGGLFPTGDPIVPFVISPRFECLNKHTHTVVYDQTLRGPLLFFPLSLYLRHSHRLCTRMTSEDRWEQRTDSRGPIVPIEKCPRRVWPYKLTHTHTYVGHMALTGYLIVFSIVPFLKNSLLGYYCSYWNALVGSIVLLLQVLHNLWRTRTPTHTANNSELSCPVRSLRKNNALGSQSCRPNSETNIVWNLHVKVRSSASDIITWKPAATLLS